MKEEEIFENNVLGDENFQESMILVNGKLQDDNSSKESIFDEELKCMVDDYVKEELKEK